MGTLRHVVALDIGTKEAGSGWLAIETTADEHHLVDAENTRVVWCGMETNGKILLQLQYADSTPGYEIVFEGMSSYGKAVGGSVMLSLLWIGRMIGTIDTRREYGGADPQIVLRRTVAAHLVGARRAGDPTMDSMIAKAVRERFGGFGASKPSVCGTKAARGPLFGFKADIWQAAAVAIAYAEGAKTEEGWQ